MLIKRTEHLRRHRGEIAFPGGVRDSADTTLRETALRESSEEIGLRACDVELLGVMPDFATATSGYVIRPFVGVIPYPYVFVPDGVEAERVVTTSLHVLVSPGVHRVETWDRGGEPVDVHFFELGADVVWGATARMLDGLLRLLDDA